MEEQPRIIISGGGTGGHIFPAIAIANAIRELTPGAKLLFVGAQDRMEMQRVPAAGYEIVGLPVRGFARPLWSPKNVGVIIDYLKSMRQVGALIKQFRPDVAVGVGGYASGATLDAASSRGIPCLIQEQNSYAGVTNKHLARKVRTICVAYDGMERFFPSEKIVMTGNPVRQQLLKTTLTPHEAALSFGLVPGKKTILVVGGSLGARTINESMLRHLDLIAASNVQFIWQTGRYYSAEIAERLKAHEPLPMLKVMDFITDMGAAYKASDMVISRAGASSISELCLLGMPALLIPSPNVAEDHQTKNAIALVDKEAALYVTDAEAPETAIPTAIETVNNDSKLRELSDNIRMLAMPGAARSIAAEVIKLAEGK